jgi:hypothetical protein
VQRARIIKRSTVHARSEKIAVRRCSGLVGSANYFPPNPSYDIYDCFTMEHFQLRQRMTLKTKIYCSRLDIEVNFGTQRFFVMKHSCSLTLYRADYGELKNSFFLYKHLFIDGGK